MNIITTALVKGLAFGITMSVIPGPIFFLIVQRTLSEGAATGILCALGSVTADAAYAIIAAIGLTFIMQFLLSYQALLSVIGGLFLIYLGLVTFFQKPSVNHVNINNSDTRLISAYFSTFFLTIANPVTVLSYCVMFAGLGVESIHQNFSAALALVFGVVTGAMIVMSLLIFFLRRFKKQLSDRALILICQFAGIVLACFGLAALFGGAISSYYTSCKI